MLQGSPVGLAILRPTRLGDPCPSGLLVLSYVISGLLLPCPQRPGPLPLMVAALPLVVAAAFLHLLIGGGHKTIYDASALSMTMEAAGFKEILDSDFDRTRSPLIEKYTYDMFPELSLYMEAVKPAASPEQNSFKIPSISSSATGSDPLENQGVVEQVGTVPSGPAERAGTVPDVPPARGGTVPAGSMEHTGT